MRQLLNTLTKRKRPYLVKRLMLIPQKKLEDQDWFKSDLFSAREKDFIKEVWIIAGTKINND